MLNFGNQIKETRQNLGYSQVRLAALSGVSLPTIQNIEGGRGNPSLDVIENLIASLGLSITIGTVAPDWDYLAQCGVPLTSLTPSEKKPEADSFFVHLRLAVIAVSQSSHTDDFDRKLKAIQATLLALKDQYPSYYIKHLHKVPAVQTIWPKTITGPLIKLRRISIELLARFL